MSERPFFRWFSSDSLVVLVIALLTVSVTHFVGEAAMESRVANVDTRLEKVEDLIQMLHSQHTDIALVQRDIHHIRQDVESLRLLVSNMLVPAGTVTTRTPDDGERGSE